MEEIESLRQKQEDSQAQFGDVIVRWRDHTLDEETFRDNGRKVRFILGFLLGQC